MRNSRIVNEEAHPCSMFRLTERFINSKYHFYCRIPLYMVLLTIMSRKTSIDSAGRLVIPKEFRDRYGFREGEPIEIIAVPDGITLIAARSERKIVKRGRVVAIDTGAESAPAEIFAIDRIRSEQFDQKDGRSQ